MKFGIGLYGCGFIGKAHTYGYLNLPLFYDSPVVDTELIGVCTSQEKTAKKAKKQLGFKFATTDYHDLLKRDDIDIVHCCTPNYLHYNFLVEAIKADKHIYCEKPLVLNEKEAEEILKLAQKVDYNKKLQITYQNRYLPAIMRAKQLIENDFLGEIFGFRAQYLHSGYIDKNRPMSWRLDIDKSGAGALGDLGSHVIDLIYYLLGPYEKVLATQKTFIKERPYPASEKKGQVKVDDITMSMVYLANGAMGNIEAWRLATGSEDDLRFEIHGKKGAMRFNLMEPNWLEVYDNCEEDGPIGGNKGWKKIATVQKYPEPAVFPGSKCSVGWLRGHLASLHAFLTAIVEDKETSPSLKDGAYIQQVQDKMIKSAKTNKWVKIENG